jgi:hypothetical protein
VHGLNRRQRSFVGLIFVIIAILTFTISLQSYEIAHGHPFLRSPKAEDGFFVIAALIALVAVPYAIGKRVARHFCRSRVRFFRSYQHR